MGRFSSFIHFSILYKVSLFKKSLTFLTVLYGKMFFLRGSPGLNSTSNTLNTLYSRLSSLLISVCPY